MEITGKYSKLHIGIVSCIIIGILAFLYVEANSLQITEYTITSPKIPEEFEGFKILQLSDLHSKEFGRDNIRLIEQIKAQNPDIIVATGDMLNSGNDNGQVFYNLAKELVKEFKLYYIKGNHEQIAEFKAEEAGSGWFDSYMDELRNLGVIILDNDKAELKKGDASINLYGLEISLLLYRGRYSSNYNGEKSIDVISIEKKLGRREREKYNILLTHNPAYFQIYSRWGADLVLSGHVHGGIVRLPLLGGLLSPDATFFPKYDAGEFELGDSKMIVSRGLGNSTLRLRVFNRPEIITITLRRGGQ
ncbi:metallophosphoesterase [Tepidanaerobacter acetatoxydans]|uniref:metallophosphoesterase n=1 Tax=Tepidanaerobacter acetatoxydans TaxID=499229 RepID=UPI001BD32EEA|nr:metallophosphoesterase [Tepidanaerobacter acetatoxydans]